MGAVQRGGEDPVGGDVFFFPGVVVRAGDGPVGVGLVGQEAREAGGGQGRGDEGQWVVAGDADVAADVGDVDGVAVGDVHVGEHPAVESGFEVADRGGRAGDVDVGPVAGPVAVGPGPAAGGVLGGLAGIGHAGLVGAVEPAFAEAFGGGEGIAVRVDDQGVGGVPAQGVDVFAERLRAGQLVGLGPDGGQDDVDVELHDRRGDVGEGTHRSSWHARGRRIPALRPDSTVRAVDPRLPSRAGSSRPAARPASVRAWRTSCSSRSPPATRRPSL